MDTGRAGASRAARGGAKRGRSYIAGDATGDAEGDAAGDAAGETAGEAGGPAGGPETARLWAMNSVTVVVPSPLSCNQAIPEKPELFCSWMPKTRLLPFRMPPMSPHAMYLLISVALSCTLIA